MNRCATARSGSAALTRSVWGLLAVLLLNMAVLPCAMALESTDHDCSHCPPADHQQMAGHDGHSATPAELPCATTVSQCCDVGAASVDSRPGKLKVKDSVDVEFFALPAIAELPIWYSGHVSTAADPPDIHGNSPPLHVLYCVYLK